MKNLAIFLLLAALIIFPAFAQPGSSPVGDAFTLLPGEHTPVIHTGSGTASASGAYVTQWLQIGYSSQASASANSNIGRYNPEQFTLGLKLACSGGGDSALVSSARFELAYDTASAPFWIGDSSNVVIASRGYASDNYGLLRFEPLAYTSRSWLYPLRVLQGGYIRFNFATTTSDAVAIVWTLTGEH